MSLPQRIVVEILELQDLQNPSLVYGFPGSGYVRKLTIDHMIEEQMGHRAGGESLPIPQHDKRLGFIS